MALDTAPLLGILGNELLLLLLLLLLPLLLLLLLLLLIMVETISLLEAGTGPDDALECVEVSLLV